MSNIRHNWTKDEIREIFDRPLLSLVLEAANAHQQHHAFGEVNGRKGLWGHAIGGMGAITQAMAASARAHGAEIETDAGVRELIVEGDRAVGVILDNGTMIKEIGRAHV